MGVSLVDREVSTEVIESCRRGDREALRVLYEMYKDKIYSISLYFFHGDAAAAGDATQQVFVKLMTNIGQFRGESEFSTWLYRLVVNTCLDDTRRGKRHIATVELDHLSASASQETNMQREQITGRVQAALSSLPPKLRIPVLLRYFEELSYTQMAETMNCSMGTVASRLRKGHELLAQKLEKLRDV